jgi:hypothetical protein
MMNAAVAEELPGVDELDELYRLDATETEPEDDEGVEPEEMPHPVEPEEMPHPVEPEEMPHP